MLKGFTHARLACGCGIGFRERVEGSPVTVVVEQKGPGCPLALHVRDLPLFDHREVLRPSTRLLPPIEEDYEDPQPGGSAAGRAHLPPLRSASRPSRFPQQELNLPGGSQIVICPALQRLHDFAVDPQQEWLAPARRSIGRSSRC